MVPNENVVDGGISLSSASSEGHVTTAAAAAAVGFDGQSEQIESSGTTGLGGWGGRRRVGWRWTEFSRNEGLTLIFVILSGIYFRNMPTLGNRRY